MLALLQQDPAPITVVDTHAGAGVYDLGDAHQARSREAEAGVARLTAHSVATWCVVDLVRPGGGLECAALSHREPQGQALLEQVRRLDLAPGADSPLPTS